MQQVAPAGPVYQAGTLSGNPLAVAAGDTTLELLAADGVYAELERTSAAVADGLLEIAARKGVPLQVPWRGAMLCTYFSDAPVTCLADVTRCDLAHWKRFFHGLLERGVLLPPSPYEAWFLSTAHDDAAVAHLLEAADQSL
jgi:glutamate-1-semialdehyde 2,1-aminomutase